ncbi:MAG: hypothetical protein KA163_12445 [Bacteroidia bacterium]|nr:hypothetical protein [Bacteroidia bacterium]
MKKNIPLIVLETLQPIVDRNAHIVKAIKDENSFFHMVDIDDKSEFFFKVSKQENRGDGLYYLTEYKPRKKEYVDEYSGWIKLEHVIAFSKNWIDVLEGYNSIHTVHDDPILKSNQERFEKQFEILDKDAETSSFDLQQQIYLNEYLETVKLKLETLKEGKDDKSVEELKELENEATNIQKGLTKETKKQIVKKLSKLWAKAQIIGLDVIKEIFVNITADLAKKLLTGG